MDKDLGNDPELVVIQEVLMMHTDLEEMVQAHVRVGLDKHHRAWVLSGGEWQRIDVDIRKMER